MQTAWHRYALIIHQRLYQGCDSVRHTLVFSTIWIILTYLRLWNGAGRYGTRWMGDPGLLESSWRPSRISGACSIGTENPCEGNWIKPRVSNFGKFLCLQYASVQENDRFLLASPSLQMQNLMCAPSLPLRQVMKRLGTKLDGRSGNWDNLLGLESLDRGGEDSERGRRLHYCSD